MACFGCFWAIFGEVSAFNWNWHFQLKMTVSIENDTFNWKWHFQLKMTLSIENDNFNWKWHFQLKMTLRNLTVPSKADTSRNSEYSLLLGASVTFGTFGDRGLESRVRIPCWTIILKNYFRKQTERKKTWECRLKKEKMSQ